MQSKKPIEFNIVFFIAEKKELVEDQNYDYADTK